MSWGFLEKRHATGSIHCKANKTKFAHARTYDILRVPPAVHNVNLPNCLPLVQSHVSHLLRTNITFATTVSFKVSAHGRLEIMGKKNSTDTEKPFVCTCITYYTHLYTALSVKLATESAKQKA